MGNHPRNRCDRRNDADAQGTGTSRSSEWLDDAASVVAADSSDTVLGTANMYANRPAQGSHIASGSIMVAQPARGRGVGRALVRDMIDWAGRTGFAAIQFNAVVETNAPAVGLYRSEGFTIIGTAPGAFVHPRLGEVGLHIMWRQLRPLPLSRRVG